MQFARPGSLVIGHWSLPVNRLRLIVACCQALLLLGAPLSLSGQDANSPRLIDQAPFDVLTLDKANDNRVLKIHPVKLPGRQVPEKPRGSDKLRVMLLADNQEYEVAWSNIARLELFEQLVLAEANQLTANGKFDEAYEYFAFLLKLYPHTPGLAEARQNYLYQAAGAAFRQQKYEEALAVLEELLAQNRNFRAGAGAPPLLQVLGNIADAIITAHVQRQDYRSARALLDRLARQYQAENEPFVRRWRQQFTDLAARHRDEARQHLEAGRFIEAHDASRAMRQVWPDLPGAAELVAEIASRHPLVTVGVQHPALDFDPAAVDSLHNVSARRAGRLTQRFVVELAGLGPEGGQYDCPLGTLSHSDDGLALFFRLPTTPASADSYDLVQRLLARAEPTSRDYHPTWAQLVSAVHPQGSGEVRVDLRFPHVLPEALLRIPISGTTVPVVPGSQEAGRPPSAPYIVHSRDSTITRYTLNRDYAARQPGQLATGESPGRPAEIVERYFDDPQQALRALVQGEIDVLDRVFPGDIAALRSNRNIAVAPYRAPTTHVLAVRSEHPYLASRTFRRALLYGSNRELLLQQGLLRGKPLAGFRVVSAPFPAPSSAGDLPAYGYDAQIEPRPYDPRLALTLRLLAEGELKAASAKQQKEPPQLTPLVLGHPADEVSRIACRGLVRQWQQIGIVCQLVEFAAGVFDDTEDKCDLVYLQLAAWEPLVDASRLLGPDGLAPTSSPYIQLTLRQLETARNWQDARQRLLHLHRLLHEEVALLPLWQTMDHYAYRRTLQGISPRRMRLYQDVEQWQAATQLAGTGL